MNDDNQTDGINRSDDDDIFSGDGKVKVWGDVTYLFMY